MKLKGKTALITGGGSGIGAAIARRFVAEGAQVCIVGRRQEKLEQVAGSLPQGSALTCAGDVAKNEDVQRMVRCVLQFNGDRKSVV
jgi:meso-butanediol dehydrogenase/(S,S)-butanediol dehydrogenase/diacetyl reductase